MLWYKIIETQIDFCTVKKVDPDLLRVDFIPLLESYTRSFSSIERKLNESSDANVIRFIARHVLEEMLVQMRGCIPVYKDYFESERKDADKLRLFQRLIDSERANLHESDEGLEVWTLNDCLENLLKLSFLLPTMSQATAAKKLNTLLRFCKKVCGRFFIVPTHLYDNRLCGICKSRVADDFLVSKSMAETCSHVVVCPDLNLDLEKFESRFDHASLLPNIQYPEMEDGDDESKFWSLFSGQSTNIEHLHNKYEGEMKTLVSEAEAAQGDILKAKHACFFFREEDFLNGVCKLKPKAYVELLCKTAKVIMYEKFLSRMKFDFEETDDAEIKRRNFYERACSRYIRRVDTKIKLILQRLLNLLSPATCSYTIWDLLFTLQAAVQNKYVPPLLWTEELSELDLTHQFHILADRSLDNKALSQIEDEAFGLLLCPYLTKARDARVFPVRNAILVNRMLTQLGFAGQEKAALKLLYRPSPTPRTVREALHRLNKETPTSDIQKFICSVMRVMLEKYAFKHEVGVLKTMNAPRLGHFIVVLPDCFAYIHKTNDGVFSRRCRSSLECFAICNKRRL